MELVNTDNLKQQLTSQYNASFTHCFVVESDIETNQMSLDFSNIVDDISRFIAKRKPCTVKIIDHRLIIFKFPKQNRIRLNNLVRGDCIITRVKLSKMLKHIPDSYELFSQEVPHLIHLNKI